MKNIEIKVSKETRMVFLEKNIIGNDGENLQEKLVFSFKDEFVDGQARLEYEIDGEKYFAILTKVGESYEIPVKNVIAKEFQINMQLVITEGTDENEIPVFKSNVFYVFVNKSINAETEEPDGYKEWLDIANTKLNSIDEAINRVQEVIDYAQEQGDYAKEEGTNAKNVSNEIQKKVEDGTFNGKSLEFIWDGTKLGIRLEGESEYQFVNLQGIQGIKGDTGEPFKIKKTYPSVEQMKLDFSNMEFGDYVMIASSVEVEDNAKLYTRGEFEWIYITDFSGAMGIRGETGLTPNIQIGNVQTLEPNQQATVTRSGTNENPVFNFALPKGGDYQVTEEDLQEIATEITENANSKFNENVNLQTESFNKMVDESIEDYNENASELLGALDVMLPKNDASGVPIYVDDALPYKVFNYGAKGNYEQETTTGKNLLPTQVTSWESGHYDTSGIKTANSSRMRLIDLLEVSPSTTYYLSHNLGAIQFAIREYDANQNFIYNTGGIDSGGTFTTQSNAKFLGISLLQPYSNYNELNNKVFMVNNNVSDKTWEQYTGKQPSPNPEYPQEIEVIEGDVSYRSVGKNQIGLQNQETITLIDLKGNFVGKLPNGVADRLLYKDGHIYLEKNISKVVLDGSEEDWVFDSSSITPTNRTVLKKKFVAKNTYYISNRFIRNNPTSNKLSVSTVELYISLEDSLTGILTNDSNTTKIEKIKTWLSTHNTEVYCESPTTELIDLGEYDLSTLEGVNNITLLANLEPGEMNLTYAQNIKIYTDNTITKQIVGALGGEY